MNANDFPEQVLDEQQTRRSGGLPSSDSRELMSISGSTLLLKEEVYQVVGAAMEVLNGLDHGLNESGFQGQVLSEQQTWRFGGLPSSDSREFASIRGSASLLKEPKDRHTSGRFGAVLPWMACWVSAPFAFIGVHSRLTLAALIRAAAWQDAKRLADAGKERQTVQPSSL